MQQAANPTRHPTRGAGESGNGMEGTDGHRQSTEEPCRTEAGSRCQHHSPDQLRIVCSRNPWSPVKPDQWWGKCPMWPTIKNEAIMLMENIRQQQKTHGRMTARAALQPSMLLAFWRPIATQTMSQMKVPRTGSKINCDTIIGGAIKKSGESKSNRTPLTTVILPLE